MTICRSGSGSEEQEAGDRSENAKNNANPVETIAERGSGAAFRGKWEKRCEGGLFHGGVGSGCAQKKEMELVSTRKEDQNERKRQIS